MATQLKASDYQHITVPGSPPQHIRIGFVDGKAQKAVQTAVSKLPASMRAATLDELATAPLRSLLLERNTLIEQVNRGANWTEEQDDAALAVINRLESVVLERPALTPDDAIVKLIAVAQVGAEGHEVDEKEAACAISEARRHFGIGYLHDGFADLFQSSPAGDGAENPAPTVEAFYRQYTPYALARRARVEYERAIYLPASPLLDDPVQIRFDDMVDAEFQALMRLLKTPAPSGSELAIKLQLLEDERWIYQQLEEVSEQLTADARHIGGVRTEHDADRTLLAAYAGCRRSMTALLQDDLSDQAGAAIQEQLDVDEAFLVDNQADTIEGVIAKLRVAFRSLVGESWSDEAVIDPAAPEFTRGIHLADMYQQLMWRGIEDLARIAGVNLAEQGA